jgi:hypothetical protein
LPVNLVNWKIIPPLYNSLKIYNSYNLNYYLRFITSSTHTPLSGYEFRPPVTLSYSHILTHPTFLLQALNLNENALCRLVGFPVTILEPDNFNFDVSSFPGEEFALLMDRYFKRPKWELPYQSITRLIKVRRRKHAARFKPTVLSKRKKLHYILHSIQKFLAKRSNQLNPFMKPSNKLFSGARVYMRKGRRKRLNFLATQPTHNWSTRSYLRKQAVFNRTVRSRLWRLSTTGRGESRGAKQVVKKKARKLFKVLKGAGLASGSKNTSTSLGLLYTSLYRTVKQRNQFKWRRLGLLLRRPTNIRRRKIKQPKLIGVLRTLRRDSVRLRLGYHRRQTKNSDHSKFISRRRRRLFRTVRFRGTFPRRFRLRKRYYRKLLNPDLTSHYLQQNAKLWSKLHRRRRLRRTFNYHKKAYMGGLGKGQSQKLTNSAHYLANAAVDLRYSRIQTLYYKTLTLLLKVERPSNIYLKAGLPNLVQARVKPYIFLNSGPLTQTLPKKPTKSLKLMIRGAGKLPNSKLLNYRRVQKDYRYPTKVRPGNYRVSTKRIRYSVRNFKYLHLNPTKPYHTYTEIGRIALNPYPGSATYGALSSSTYKNLLLRSYTPRAYTGLHLSFARRIKVLKFLTVLKIRFFKRAHLKRTKRSTRRHYLLNRSLPRPLDSRKLSLLSPLLVTVNNLPYSKTATRARFKGLTLRLHLHSLKHKSFVFGNVGMFLVYQANLLKQVSLSLRVLITQLQHRQYSFWFKAEDKRRIMGQKRMQVLARIVTRSKKIIPSNPWVSYTSAAHNLVRKTMLAASTTVAYSSLASGLTERRTKTTKQLWNLVTGSDSFPTIMNLDLYRSGGYGTSYAHVNQDPQIRRIRFKPGYQRIWRQARSALLEVFGLRFQYQKRLTKYLVGYAGYSSPYQVTSMDATLGRTLIFSRLVHNLPTAQTLVTQSLVFLNYRIASDAELLVAPNDFIQILVSLRYYLTFRWLSNWTILRLRRIRRLIFRKSKAKQYKASNLRKQISRYIPNWVYDMRYDDFDTKPYLEVDYLTLSIFVLTEPHLISYYRAYDLPDLPIHHSVYRMYNWKYIN